MESVDLFWYWRKTTWFCVVKCYVHTLCARLFHTHVQWLRMMVQWHWPSFLLLQTHHLLRILQTQRFPLSNKAFPPWCSNKLRFRCQKLIQLTMIRRWKHLDRLRFGIFRSSVQFPIHLDRKQFPLRLVPSLKFAINKFVTSINVQKRLTILLVQKSKKRCFLRTKIIPLRLYLPDHMLINIMMQSSLDRSLPGRQIFLRKEINR